MSNANTTGERHKCGGCFNAKKPRTFTSTGLNLHVKTSPNPLCAAWSRRSPSPHIKPLPPSRPIPAGRNNSKYAHRRSSSPRQQRSSSPVAGPSNTARTPTPSEHDSDAGQAPRPENVGEPFVGDFFGEDYGEDELPFGGEDESQEAPDASVSEAAEGDVAGAGHEVEVGPRDDESDEEEENLEGRGWEPPVPPGHENGEDGDRGENPVPMDDELAEEFRRRFNGDDPVNQGVDWETAVRVKYGNGAGRTWDQRESTYDDYLAQLPEGASDNAYFPFMSKLDWEFGKWAKTRGPSSTSVTELLGIEGVSLVLFSHLVGLPLSFLHVHDV